MAPINKRLEQLAAQVACDKGVEVVPLLAVLVKLGEAGVKDEEIPKRLDKTADELIELRAKFDTLQQGSPGLAAIAQEAQALIDKGDLDGASRALAARREASRTRRIDASREDAEILRSIDDPSRNDLAFPPPHPPQCTASWEDALETCNPDRCRKGWIASEQTGRSDGGKRSWRGGVNVERSVRH